MHPLPKLKPYENIYDYGKYKLEHFQYRIIRDTDADKWGNIDVILTEYVEGSINNINYTFLLICYLSYILQGIGYKGEIVNVPRELAYTELLPAQLALYAIPENVQLFEEERKLLVDRPKISPFVMKCRDYLQTIVLEIPINMKQKAWALEKQHIRVALRRIVSNIFIFCNGSIQAATLFCTVSAKL